MAQAVNVDSVSGVYGVRAREGVPSSVWVSYQEASCCDVTIISLGQHEYGVTFLQSSLVRMQVSRHEAI